MKTKIVFAISLFIFMGCKNEDKNTDIDTIIAEITTKFPQLPKGGTEHYQLEKSIKNGKYNFEIQLYAEADTIKDPQKILIFINAQKECYAIPFFSNTYRDYWEFKHEIPLPNVKKLQSTFNKEYLKALINLQLNKIEVCRSVTNDMLISVLNSNKISNCDFLNLKEVVYMNDNVSLDAESDYDYLKEKWIKNNEEILKSGNSELDVNDVKEILGYLDRRNYRFYQVIFGDGVMDVNKNPQKIITSDKELQIKIYRKDQIIHRINL